MRHSNRLLLVYISALAILFGSVVTSLVLTEMEAYRIEADAQKINVSGRQRMLSQRIIYLAQDLIGGQSAGTEQVQAELAYAIEELERSIALFEASHDRLARDTGITETERAGYFDAPNGGVSLDDSVRAYLGFARNILADPTDTASLEGLVQIERAGLLDRLDALVSLIEAQSIQTVDRLRLIGRVALIAALLIVLVEIAFVFIPGHRLIQRQIREAKEKTEELEAAVARSEQLRLEQAEFTYAVSHDLKSPANTVTLILNELTSEYRAEVSEEVLDLMFEATSTVNRMGVQIEDILQYAWATGDAEEVQEVDISACVEESKADLREAITTSGARVEMGSTAVVQGFRRQISMLLRNLIENGLKYQPEGADPVVSITAEEIPGRGGARLRVRDNGIGIAPEHHEKVFGLFQRLHLNSEYPGSGLGLATCRRVAENHRGAIGVSAAPGAGCEFEVILYPPTAAVAAPTGDERMAA